MAFRFKDLMVSVTSGGGTDDPICTIATMKEPDPAGQAATCTVDTMDPARQAYTCTVDTMDPLRQAHTCTVDTMPGIAGLRRAGGNETGICTIATMFPSVMALTTVTTVTTLAQAVSPGAGSLAELKGQLQQALADVERREREAQAAQALPQTVEEANELERRLEGALQELRDHRKSLEKGGAKGPKKEAPKARKPKK